MPSPEAERRPNLRRWRHASGNRPAAEGGALRGRHRDDPRRGPAGRDRPDRRADPGRGEGHRPARRDRHRQDGDGRVGRRAAAAPGAGHAAQQDPRRPVRQRAARDDAEQRGRVLRLLLRLLPARGVHPADRHLHREGLLDQRRGRAAAALRHQQPADPAGHDRRRLRLLHLRPRHPAGVRRPHAQGQARRHHGARPAAAQAGRHAVHPQRHRLHPRHLPGPRRHHRDHPAVRGARGADRDVRRRDRAAVHAAPADRRGDQRGRGAVRLPRDPLRGRRGADGARHRRHRGRAGRAARRAGAPGQAA